MSLLKSNSVQIGQSATATNNFTLSVPSSPDGTIKLARGNSGATTQDILTVNSSGAVTLTNGGAITLATAQASTSGTAIDFTGIPSRAKRITVMISGLSTSGTSPHLLRVGTSSGFVTSGYTSGVSVYGGSNIVNSANNTNGFNFSPTPVDASVACGALTLLNVSGNTWVHTSVIGFTDAAFAATGGGNIALGGLLDRVRITTVNGTDAFDAGSINIIYEG